MQHCSSSWARSTSSLDIVLRIDGIVGRVVPDSSPQATYPPHAFLLRNHVAKLNEPVRTCQTVKSTVAILLYKLWSDSGPLDEPSKEALVNGTAAANHHQLPPNASLQSSCSGMLSLRIWEVDCARRSPLLPVWPQMQEQLLFHFQGAFWASWDSVLYVLVGGRLVAA